ncbi:MAG: hypothetical protein B7Y67_18520, partial [Polynucleobacter sp. 35-46-11]
MKQQSRRNFLKTSAVSAVAIGAATGSSIDTAYAQSKPPKSNIE